MRCTLSLLISLPFFTACSTGHLYETADIKKSIQHVDNQVQRLKNRVENDFKSRQKLVQKVRRAGVNFKNAKYKNLNNDYESLNQKKAAFNRALALFEEKKQLIYTLTADKAQISSKTPEFAQLEKLRDEIPETLPAIENAAKTYRSGSLAFNQKVQNLMLAELRTFTRTRQPAAER